LASSRVHPFVGVPIGPCADAAPTTQLKKVSSSIEDKDYSAMLLVPLAAKPCRIPTTAFNKQKTRPGAHAKQRRGGYGFYKKMNLKLIEQ
jgi:hypothetical protein